MIRTKNIPGKSTECPNRFDRAALNFLALFMVLIGGWAFEAYSSVSKGRDFVISETRANGTVSQYYIWVPDSITKFRGVIAHHHCCGGDASAPSAEMDYTWRYLAEKHECLYVVPKENEDCYTWYLAANGSFPSMKAAVDSVGKLVTHPELSNVPYALWGHSGGADWVAEALKAYTAQIAVANPRSADYQDDPTGAGIKGVPVLWEWGGPTDHGGDCADLTTYTHGRSAGMPWTCGIEQDGSHDASMSRAFCIPYLDAELSARLPQTGSISIALDTSTMWLGCSTGVNVFTVYPPGAFTGNRASCALLPNEEYARFWKRAMQTLIADPQYWHKIDTTPPLPPQKLRATSNASTGIRLEWDLIPDMESGAKDYRIYRNGTQVYDYCSATGKAELQPTGFDDEASTGETPLMVYTDKSITWGTTYTYEVSTINRAGLESGKSSLVVPTGNTLIRSESESLSPNLDFPIVMGDGGRFQISLPEGSVNVVVFSIDGCRIPVQIDEGTNRLSANSPKNGLYVIHGTTAGGAAFVQKVNVVRR